MKTDKESGLRQVSALEKLGLAARMNTGAHLSAEEVREIIALTGNPTGELE